MVPPCATRRGTGVCDNGVVPRLRLDLAYDGTDFHGWARQPGLRTVQGELESAIDTVLRVPVAQDGRGGVSVVVAGRTDSGVHAAHQVCHMDIDQRFLDAAVGHMNVGPVEAFARRLRRKLPPDVAVLSVEPAPDGFDARFSALERTYVYRIGDDGADFDPRIRGHVAYMEGTLDVDAMNDAIAHAVGLHDFGSFATPNPGGTTIRLVKYARWIRVPHTPLGPWERDGSATVDDNESSLGAEALDIPVEESGLVCLAIVADAFAHNMVRCLVGAAIKVGQGDRNAAWFADKVAQPLREGSTGPSPACGLTLERVRYPDAALLAERARSIRAKRTLP